jgi:tripartite-type tricarboxylate transporter receptor subunit TctC
MGIYKRKFCKYWGQSDTTSSEGNLLNEKEGLMSFSLRGVILAFCGVIFFVTPSPSAEKSFYQGKNVNFIINFAAGGPTDIEGRIVARHLAKHIPGQPTFIPQNMAGAGGVTGMNFLGEVAKPDGLTMGYFTGPYNHQMMRTPSLRIDLGKLPFIAAVGSVTVCYIRSDVPPGIKKPTDIAKAERFRAGGLSFDSNKDLRFRLAFDILGLKYDYVTGYNSSNDARLAVQRNEIQYHDENIPGYRGVVEPQLVKTGIVTPLYYHDVVKPDGTMGKSPDYPELNSFTEVYTQIHGKAPTGIKYETLKAANMASQNLSRVALLPPGSPPEAIAALRQAFAGLSKDEEFIAEAMKVMRFHPRFEVGEDGEKLKQKVLTAPPEIIDFVRQFIEQARK